MSVFVVLLKVSIWLFGLLFVRIEFCVLMMILLLFRVGVVCVLFSGIFVIDGR